MVWLYLDEMLGEFVQPLVERGHDVVAATDPFRRSQPDAWHLRRAIDEARILLTRDRGDFEYLHDLWTALHLLGVVPESHSGILSMKGSDASTWLDAIQARIIDVDGLTGQMLTWLPTQHEWQEAKSQPAKD